MMPRMDFTKAVQMNAYGGPEVLVLTTLAPLQADEVRIRSIASAVNHTDLVIRAGTVSREVARLSCVSVDVR